MVNVVVRSTRVPMAERSSPMSRSHSQCPGHGPVFCLGWSLADHHLGGDVCPDLLAWPGLGDAKRPSGAQAGHQLSLERTAALDVQGLVDRLVTDPHGLIIRQIDGEPLGDWLGAPGLHPARRPARWGLFFPVPPRARGTVEPSGGRCCFARQSGA